MEVVYICGQPRFGVAKPRAAAGHLPGRVGVRRGWRLTIQDVRLSNPIRG